MPKEPDFASARGFALSALETRLSPHLSYHSLYHTRDDALPAVERLARLEGVSESELLLLRTAVLFHDLGFTVQVNDHEAISAQMASEALPGFGYTPAQVHEIVGMILVTKVFTPPRTLLEALVVDADLDVLGRDDFLKRSYDLRDEHTALGNLSTQKDWLLAQIRFLDTHRYRTISAQSLRGASKQKNYRLLHNLLDQARRDGSGGHPSP